MGNRFVNEMTTLIAELFHCQSSELSVDMGPGDIPGWDSLGHVTLIEAMYTRYGDVLPLAELSEATSISELASLIEDHV